jgi:hypothetical protein
MATTLPGSKEFGNLSTHNRRFASKIGADM